MAAPLGNTNAKKSKRWMEALNRALARASNDSIDKGLDKIADTVVAAAIAGDKDAWQEVANRQDGKVAQAIIGGDEGDPAVKTISEVILRAVDATTDRPA